MKSSNNFNVFKVPSNRLMYFLIKKGSRISHLSDSSWIAYDLSQIEEVSVDVTHYNSVSSEC